MTSLSTINLDIASKLQDLDYRRAFFHSFSRDEVACAIRDLRELRGLNQAELAKRSEMKQSAISRLEDAEYSSWTYKTLLRIADALDARLRILLEPAEQVISEYENGIQDYVLSATDMPGPTTINIGSTMTMAGFVTFPVTEDVR